MADIVWAVCTVNIKLLKAHPDNPRILTKEAAGHLSDSLDKFGLIDKPVINTDFTIIGGHQRIALLKKQKVKEIECNFPSRPLTEEEVKELMVRLNRNHGAWDYDILANNWEPTELIDWGFNESELIGDINEPTQGADDSLDGDTGNTEIPEEEAKGPSTFIVTCPRGSEMVVATALQRLVNKHPKSTLKMK